jgi:hypothetical protein
VTVEGYKILQLMATLPFQIGKHTLVIILTDFYNRTTTETIKLKVINDPPVFRFGAPKSQKIKMNQVSTYCLPTYFDLELLPVTLTHTKLPPFCTFSDDIYTFEPISNFGKFEVSGYLSDSLMKKTSFSFKVEVTNSKPYFKDKLNEISLNQE